LKVKEIGETIIRNWPAKILSLAIAVLLFYFYKLNTTEEHYINVPLDVIINNNFVAAETYPTHVRISLRGSSESIFLINEKDITAHVDFSTRRESGDYREPIKIKKSGNALYADPLEVRVKPTEIRLRIEEKFTKNVPVVPVIKGFSGENYEIISSAIVPDNITIEGPINVVEKITLVRTEDINLENRKESFTFPVKLEKASEFIKFIESDEVQFYGKIERSRISKNIAPIEIEVREKNNNMLYDIEYNTGSIKLEAGRRIIDFFNVENCFLYVDVSGIDIEGTYNLPVIASVPETEGGASVIVITPETLKVNITKKER
jgi:YbbR domain-containing protein